MGLDSPFVGVVGGTGRMGSWFVRYFEDQGFRVHSTGKEDSHRANRMVGKWDVVVLSVPIGAVRRVVRDLAPLVREDALLMDLTSIKREPLVEMLRWSRSEVVGVHPLFGPEAVPGEPLRIALCPGRGDRGLQWLKGLFEGSGMRPVVIDAEKHDRLMGIVQGVNHFLTLSMALFIKESGFGIQDLLLCSTETFGRRVDRIRSLLEQSPELFRGILSENPAALEFSRQWQRKSEELARILETGDKDAFERIFEELGECFKG